jgi:hypothetical protein
MKVVAFTFGGMVYFIKICQPLNAFRAILSAIVVVVLSVWAIFLLDTTPIIGTNFFGLSALFPLTLDNWQYPLIIFSIIQLNFPLVELFYKFTKFLNTSIDKAKQDDVSSI